VAFSRSVSTRAPTVRVPLMGTGPPSTPQGWLQGFRRYAAPRRSNLQADRAGARAELQRRAVRLAIPTQSGTTGRGGKWWSPRGPHSLRPSRPNTVGTARTCQRAEPALRQLSPAPPRGASPEALPPRAWSLPRQLFPPARMSKRRDVPIRVFMPFLGVRTVGCPAWARCSVSGDPSHQLNPIVPSAHVEEDLLPTRQKVN